MTNRNPDSITLFNDDCLKALPNIPDESIDFIFTDLPYGTTRNKWDELIPLAPLWKEFRRVIKPHGCIALWSQEPFTSLLITSGSDIFRYKWIVEKTNATGFLNARRMPLKAYEEVCIFYKNLPTYNPQKTTGHERKVSTAAHRRNTKHSTNYNYVEYNSYDSTERFPRDIISFKWDKQKSSIHPTQKPVAACEYFIRTYTNEGDTVLDATMGSGSTGVACLNTGRKFIGIELDETYFNAAKERLENCAEKAGLS